MASQLIIAPDIVSWLKTAGEILLRPPTAVSLIGKPKDPEGNILTIRDLEVQHHLVDRILKTGHDFLIVGEEDITEETGGACKTSFPETMPEDKTVAIIDPIDGSKNWTIGKQFAITFAMQRGDTVFFAAVYFPKTETIYVVDRYLGMTRNFATYTPAFKLYDADSISVAYGIGKVLSKNEQAEFIGILNALSDKQVDLDRPGCASDSFFGVFNGVYDIYASAKERWTNIAPLYKMAKDMGFYISADPAYIDLNSDFRMAVATPAFASIHLQSGSPLAKFLQI